MNRETDTVFLQTLGRFIIAQVQLATTPLLQKIEQLEKTISQLNDVQDIALTDHENITRELDGAIEGFAAEIARVEKQFEGCLKPSDAASIAQGICDVRIEALPKPENGKDGKDGKDGIDGKDFDDWDMINEQLSGGVEMIRGELKKYVDELPKPKDGKDADMDALFVYVENYIKAIPLPHNGKDGLNGKDGNNGADGKDGPVGPSGADVVAAFRDSDGHLVLTLSNGVTKDVGLIHGRDGKDGLPGKDGKDGLGFKDMSAVWDGERTLIFKFVLEDRVEELQISIPFPLFRGIWKRGNEYTQGDSVGYEGSTWICLRNTDKQPGTSDSGWILSTKRGLDGKPGEQGKQGLPGKDGERGRDLTQMGFDGKKW